ncbi:type II secretion system inner membrane protein GspF [Caldimonas aquatica]|uniref:Type II secretion system inner membrane protein GspF n=1 Tax=Caldimonas aquatica TaxID=376175 RepID=A0ABY6MRE7_9BURK|nr:type II secretion system inner membrane protein GspF [Schlegelella aquatica]UZD54589.1 type II secretion system inner membrane protein GspF [Schlegelella aquatica]
MPAYRFEALDAAGRTSTGLLDADNARAARAQLRAQKLVPLEVTPVGAQEGAREVRLRRRVFNATALAIWTRQLAGLVSAGLPLERALTALADEAEDERQRELLAHLRSEVNAGSTFAKALATAPREFDEIYRAVVAAGEQSGSLGKVLEKLADDLEERQALKARIVGAALYPAIVSLVAVVIVIFLVTYVVPQVASVFSGGKRSLPFLTVAMLALSDFVRHWGWLLALGLVAGGGALAVMLRNEGFRLRFDAAWLRLPLVGRLSRGYNAARFAGTLAMLAGAGVPILKALQAAAETLGNRAMRADALEALVLVREGAPLAAALAGKKRFPGLLAMFARLGEQTGDLSTMLARAAQQLGQEVQRRAMQMATILEPLLIVTMGLVVMLIVLAVLLPIIELQTWVR